MMRRSSMLGALAITSRTISRLIERWPLILIAVMVLSPVSPHIRLSETYGSLNGTSGRFACRYLGARGIIYGDVGGNCPLIALLDISDRGW